VNVPYVPDIGETFEITRTWPYRRWQWTPFPWHRLRVYSETHRYRVQSWLRRRSPLLPPASEEEALVRQFLDQALAEEGLERRWHGPDNVPLEWCYREEAEYVIGYGVAGTIQRVADVTVTGRVSWDEKTIQEHRDFANQLAGEPLT
jgi:hypothetical protein